MAQSSPRFPREVDSWWRDTFRLAVVDIVGALVALPSIYVLFYDGRYNHQLYFSDAIEGG